MVLFHHVAMQDPEVVRKVFFQCVRYGNLPQVQQMANFNLLTMEDEDGDKAMHVAVYASQPKVLEFLCSTRVDPDQYGCSGRTPLNVAAYEGNVECCEILLRHGASILETDALEENALHKASAMGHEAILYMLLQAPGMVQAINQQNVLGSTPLHQAMEKGNEVCAKLLMAAGASGTLQDYFGYCPTFIPKATMPHWYHQTAGNSIVG